MLIAGVDEAGRGPVIGPMVMAIAACEEKEEQILKKAGVGDSGIPPGKREELFNALHKYSNEIIVVDPMEIDKAVNARNDNLNMLEARTTALLILKLAKRTKLKKVILDSPTKNEKKYQSEIRAILDDIDTDGITKKIKLQAEIKADANYPIVGLASILAKVTRDAAIERLTEDHGPMGTGYPADPITQKFLTRHWKEGYDFFRKSWESYKRLAEGRAQSSLAEFSKKHKTEIKKFEFLKDHGWQFHEPTNQYEIVRMKNGRNSIIKYSSDKLVVQGPDKADTLKLLKKAKLA